MRKLLIGLIVLLSLISLAIGSFEMGITQETLQIIMLSRIPRLVSIWIAAAGLSVSGLLMQNLLNNRYVSPATTGSLEFVKLGILTSMFIGGSILFKMSLGFVFGVVGSFIFLKMTKVMDHYSKAYVAIMGIMLGLIVQTITTMIAYQFELVQNLNGWMQGSFTLVVKGQYELIYLGIPLLLIIYLYAKKIAVAGLGKDLAISLGLNYTRVLSVGILLVSLLSSIVILTIGNLPFVGLLIPNLITMKYGDHFSQNISYSIIYGIIFVLMLDILSRIIIFPHEIPLNLVIGVVGSILFLWLIIRGKIDEA